MMEKREKASKSLVIVFFFFLLFVSIQFLAPLTIEESSIQDLTGHTIVSDNKDLIDTLPLPYALAYELGDSLCHQKTQRSFLLNGNQMPFCSRCTAIWIGILIGLGISLLFKFELTLFFITLYLFCLAPLAVDGLGQLFGFWESTNLIRIITGLITGVITGIALASIVDEIREGMKEKKKRRRDSCV